MAMEKVVVGWSGGKDSAFALYEILKSQTYEVVALLTTVTRDYDRVSIHGVRRVLLEAQAEALGLPLEVMLLNKGASDIDYESNLVEELKKFKSRGVEKVVYGDIFLEDVKRYRDNLLAKVNMIGVYPLWKKDTGQLAHTFVDLGFKAIITVVDSKVLGSEYSGRKYNRQFLEDLPTTVDPCGENGEFHSFVYDGPIFKKPVMFKKGDILLRENRFWYCDLLPLQID
ncbi:MAG: diphthine--ammonia ligase [Candidatus Bathyarchaeota archaeon]|nr:diphthine--ammonia ligase [Candidatus Bathyarchaeota archaeon]